MFFGRVLILLLDRSLHKTEKINGVPASAANFTESIDWRAKEKLDDQLLQLSLNETHCTQKQKSQHFVLHKKYCS